MTAKKGHLELMGAWADKMDLTSGEKRFHLHMKHNLNSKTE